MYENKPHAIHPADAAFATPDGSSRRSFLAAAAASAAGSLLVLPAGAHAQSQPGVTATEILIGNTPRCRGRCRRWAPSPDRKRPTSR